jgi:hypothetical protein
VAKVEVMVRQAWAIKLFTPFYVYC